MALFAGIELCAGVGMLGEGVRAAFGFLGHEYRTVCYVEREAAAAGQLATLMEAGIIDSAPVWSDMLTFDGAAWCGKVDCIIAGFPCQDLSIAGRRAGLDGKRSGLFFRVCDIADDCDAQYLLLENVSAIASATATVMDEAEGELEERAAARVMGELADRGWDSEWITISASEVGASHRRARWFCFAWRVANPERAERRQERIGRSRGSQGHDGSREANGGTGIAIEALADAERPRWPPSRSGYSLDPGRQSESGRRDMADPNGERRQQIAGSVPANENGEARKDRRGSGHDIESASAGSNMGNARLQYQHSEQRADGAEHQAAGEPVDNTTSSRRNGTWLWPEANIESGKCLLGAGCQNMADPGSEGRQRSEQRRTRIDNRGGAGSTWTN